MSQKKRLSMTASIRKPIPAEHRLFCNHATASVLSEFSYSYKTGWSKRLLSWLQAARYMLLVTSAVSPSYWSEYCTYCPNFEILRDQCWELKNIYHPENRQFPKKKMHLQRFRLLRRVADWGWTCKMSHDCKPKWFPISLVLTPHNRSDTLFH